MKFEIYSPNLKVKIVLIEVVELTINDEVRTPTKYF